MGALPSAESDGFLAQSECIPSINAIGGHRPPQQKTLRAVAADRLDRATFHRLFAKRLFFRRFGLFVNVGVPAIIVATKIRRCRFTAKIAVNALIIDVELSIYIFGIFICGVGHFLRLVKMSWKVG
jgi:hypothetical protein